MSEISKITKYNLSKKKKIIIVSSITIFLALIFIFGYMSHIKSDVEKWNNKIYPGIFVGEVDLSGKTLEEAQELLKINFINKINSKEILVKIEGTDKEYSDTYKSIEPKYDLNSTAKNALDYGKNENLLKKNSFIRGKEKVEIPLEFTYNQTKLSSLEDKIIEKISNKAKNATITINADGSKNITKEKDGHVVDKSELDSKLKEAINGNINNKTEVVVTTKVEKPKITTKDLEKIDGVMGSYSTSYASSDYSRSTNIAVATEFVNGTLLMPGDVFSYSEATQRDKSKYKEGNVYINNKIEKDIGGGICQISTALYRTVMRANIRPEERHNHSLTVGYAKPGLDATVAWGYLDFKIKNTYDFPIYIQGYTKNKVATFKIYGDVDGLNGYTYDMEHEIVQTIAPTEKTTNDPNLEEGKRVVERSGQTGYVAKGYQITYKDGKEVKREVVSTDRYSMVPKEIRVGTKKPEPKPEPEPEQPKEEVNPEVGDPTPPPVPPTPPAPPVSPAPPVPPAEA